MQLLYCLFVQFYYFVIEYYFTGIDILNLCHVLLCLKLIYLHLSGANRAAYAPEPMDVGRILQLDIVSNGQKHTLTTDPIQPGWFSLCILSVIFSNLISYLSAILIPK